MQPLTGGVGEHYLVETQAAATNDLMAPGATQVGDKGRWYLTVLGVGHVAVFIDGVQVTTTVDFDTSGTYCVVDTGENVVRDFGQRTLSMRVWGASSIKVGTIFYLNRPLIWNAVDVLVGAPPNTITISDAGTIAPTVAQYTRQNDQALPFGSGLADNIISFVPDVDPAEDVFPLQIARGYTPDFFPPGSPTHDDGGCNFANSTEKNGVKFGDNDPAAVNVATEDIYRLTPAVVPLNIGGGAYPPTSNSNGATSFDNNDTLDVFIANCAIAGSPFHDQIAVIDQILLVRNCASAFFSGYNTGFATNFTYSFSSAGAPVDHYRIVVTDQQGDAFLAEGNVLQDINPVTSPHTVTVQGAVRVYVAAVTADGEFSCYDWDEFTAPGGQIIRYR